VLLEKNLGIEITKMWYALLKNKKIQTKIVYNKIPKEHLSVEDQKKSEILEQIEKFGYYEVAHTIEQISQNALDYLSNLGYVEKRNDVIHYFTYYYQAFPYEPYVSPFGWVGITNSNKFVSSYVLIDSAHYDHFTETAEEFKTQVDRKMHKHITAFEYRESFSYETVVYEILDKYFDTLQVWYDYTKNIFTIKLCQPYVISSDKLGDEKHYKILKDIAPEIFLENKKEIDKTVEELEWKKNSKGILIIDKKAYFLVLKSEEKKNDDFFTAPDFFIEGFASKENFLARIFEDAVAQFYSAKHGYLFLTRRKFKYLDGKEIDVFGEKTGDPKTITICECKLRFNDSKITLGELDYFHKKIIKVKENESKRGETKFHCVFISNSKNIEENVKEFAYDNNIEIRNALLPSDWQERPNWKINEIKILG
jgi:hypothetical protein